MVSKASKMYDKDKAPKLDRDNEGNVTVKEGKEPSEAQKESDSTQAGTEGAIRGDHEERHGHERREMHHRHMQEHMAMHHKHEMEHSHEEKKEEMHTRHEQKKKHLHTKHEHEHKALHTKHEKEAGMSGQAATHSELDEERGGKSKAKTDKAGEKE